MDPQTDGRSYLAMLGVRASCPSWVIVILAIIVVALVIGICVIILALIAWASPPEIVDIISLLRAT